LRLGVNIDHVATVRNARGGRHPDPVRAALAAAAAGADGITAHLREDRRHITDRDIEHLMARLAIPLNLEMAASDEMVAIACRHRPHAVCLVPERRAELTTEGGLDVAADPAQYAPVVGRLAAAGIRVSLFIDPDLAQVEAARTIGAPVVELHTGAYCHASAVGSIGGIGSSGADCVVELARLQATAERAAVLGLEVHAGHGLDYDTVGAVAAIPVIKELNIGHFLIGEAILIGLDGAVRRMRAAMDEALMVRGRSALCAEPPT